MPPNLTAQNGFCSPVTMSDIDGCHGRDLIEPLFFNDNTELHNLIRFRLILPYLTDSFHPSFIEEYAGGLLMGLQKPDGCHADPQRSV